MRQTWIAPSGRYNFFMMPRWLIALLTLHFLLSVGFSASGKTHWTNPLPGPAMSASQCKVAPTRLATLTKSVGDLANDSAVASVVEHSLADAGQELPDDQDIRFLRPACDVALAPYPNAMGSALPSPLLKRLHRPPKRHHAQRG